MNNILFFDTETTGPKPDKDNIVQLAMIMTNSSGRVLGVFSSLLSPELFQSISAGAKSVHGIEETECRDMGINPLSAIKLFTKWSSTCRDLVCHNYEFDATLVNNTAKKLGQLPPTEGKRTWCTMRQTTELTKIPFQDRHGNVKPSKDFKWPKLQELHQHLFDQPFEGAHDALQDVQATKRCFFELVKRKHFTL